MARTVSLGQSGDEKGVEGSGGVEESQVSSLQEEAAKLIPARPPPCALAPWWLKPHSATKGSKTGSVFQTGHKATPGLAPWDLRDGRSQTGDAGWGPQAEQEIRLGRGSRQLKEGVPGPGEGGNRGAERARPGPGMPGAALAVGGGVPSLREVYRV